MYFEVQMYVYLEGYIDFRPKRYAIDNTAFHGVPRGIAVTIVVCHAGLNYGDAWRKAEITLHAV
ncbi:hypothetical protein DPMN_014459 [Dreissena polymorpha]|uniref:Uncharacterized protein n=1 Tax=Dreissena polymorpha TaxID=45954 RepID=A0A9D4NAT8_DREPO|nr:hypothetical protein DPMN_014459 [Dreissena polymorpha]